MTEQERQQWRLERRKQGAELLIGGAIEVHRLLLEGRNAEALQCSMLVDIQIRALWSVPPPWVLQGKVYPLDVAGVWHE